jgi:serine/threonine-protein kinase HipA
MAARIAVYGDWGGKSEAPLRLGILHARNGPGREIFDFEFDADALLSPQLIRVQLDPRLGFFEGPQYPPSGEQNFGLFSDASPDRWGRLLMERRLEREQRQGREDKNRRLHESDYLLGVHDAYRVGALRLRLNDSGEFLDNRHGLAAPPFVQLRALETASLSVERDEENTAPAGEEWLRILIAPGGSLGGARPKASVIDPVGQLWIAKFPSLRDNNDVGAWELVVHALARGCGVEVPQSLVKKFVSPHHTFLVKRFDRTEDGSRLHFASAMTLTGRKDGDDASTGASYLEIARVLIDHGANTENDLRQLWLRIVFNMLVCNADDHLRNHGFILVPGRGWRLSQAYDMNPVASASDLKLNVSETDNAIDIDLALSVAPYFRLRADDAAALVSHCKSVVKQWPRISEGLGISNREQEHMASAFRLAQ